MKTFLKILLAMLVGIVFSACDTIEDKEEEPVIPEEEEEEREIDAENEIIDALEIDPYWNDRLQEDPGEVFDIALDTCTAIEAGTSIQDVVLDIMNEENVDVLAAEHMVEVAVFTICPEFEFAYEQYLIARSQ